VLTVAAAAVLVAGWVVAATLLWQSSRVPSDLHLPHVDQDAVFSAGVLRKTSHYQRFLRLDTVLAEVALLAMMAAYAARGARLARESAAGRIGTGMLLGMLGLALVWFTQVPFGLAGLWWERRYGISHVGYGDWLFGDWFGLGGEFLFISLAILIVMALAGVLRDRWWIVGGPVFVGLATLFVFVQPYLVPATHRLRDRALAAEARRLEDSEGSGRVPIEVQDVHEETSAPNAEATGLGPSRRVILWDTLLDRRFSRREVRFVLAHEIGHLARGHLLKGIAWYALFAVPGAFLIAVGTRRRGGMAEARAVPLGLFIVVVLQLAAMPIQSAITRHLESEADWMALQATHDPRGGAALFRHFTTVALAEPNPPTWSYLLFEDHPTVAQRIAMTRAWAARYATAAAQSP
jgi:STE24 endopeptidase